MPIATCLSRPQFVPVRFVRSLLTLVFLLALSPPTFERGLAAEDPIAGDQAIDAPTETVGEALVVDAGMESASSESDGLAGEDVMIVVPNEPISLAEPDRITCDDGAGLDV